MAYQSKNDYCGLATVFSSALTVRDDDEGKTNETYMPIGQDGSYCAVEVYGEDSNPKNSYGLKAALSATSGDIKLGKVNTVDSKKFMLESVEIGTAGGSAVTVKATSAEVETTATDGCLYSVPAFSVSTDHHAQILFGAFSVSNGAQLTACTAKISCSVGKDKVAGVKISSDIGQGKIVVSGTVLQTGSTAPTVTATAADNWVLTGALTCQNPETAYKTYTFEVTKILAKSQAPVQG